MRITCQISRTVDKCAVKESGKNLNAEDKSGQAHGYKNNTIHRTVTDDSSPHIRNTSASAQEIDL